MIDLEKENKRLTLLVKELEAQLKEVKEIARDKINISAIGESSRSKLDRIYKLIESSPTEQPEAQKDCNHEALTDTGVGYNYCPICKGSWKQQNQPQPEKVDDVQWQDIMTTAAGIEPEKAQEEQEIWEEIFLNYPVGDWLFSREYINEMIKKYSIQTRKANP